MELNYNPTISDLRCWIVEVLLKGEEISSNHLFDEWLEVIFLPGLYGIDFIDVIDSAKDKHGKLSKIESTGDLRTTIKNNLQFDSIGIIAAIKLPDVQNLDTVQNITETMIDVLNPDANVLWQATNHNKKEAIVLILSLHE